MIEKALTRRAAMGLLALIPFGKDAVASQVRESWSLSEVEPVSSLRNVHSFKDWLTGEREKQWRIQAREGAMMRLDPDIAVLRSVSLCQKIRMQAARNYEQTLQTEKSWFESMLAREGVVREYT